jgi:N6-adenosine-specific RNA methylase IME4
MTPFSRTAEAVANRDGVGRRTVHRDAQFAQALDRVAEIAGDEVRSAVLSREAKLSKEDVLRLDKQAARDPSAVKQAVERVLAGEAESVKEALREQSRQERLKRLAPGELPEGKFGLIYADPPWQYEFAEDEDRAIENHYPTMSLAELEALSVADLAAEDCLLWLWTTSPKLREALRLIEARGLEYKTSLVWMKDKIGMGYYARQQHELLLVAKRGNPPAPAPADRPPSVISAPRTAHSAKPAEVYEILERLYPEVAKVELFARRRRPGWAAWGNEVPT